MDLLEGKMQGGGQQNTENSGAQEPEELGLALYKHGRLGRGERMTKFSFSICSSEG